MIQADWFLQETLRAKACIDLESLSIYGLGIYLYSGETGFARYKNGKCKY